MTKKLEVAIGILCDVEGRLLVGRRMRSPQWGKWEMPGGKVEPGETVLQALRREFNEEGGIMLEEIAHWTRIEDNDFILYLFKVYSNDTFIPTIYEEYRYVEIDELLNLDWIESNLEFVSDLRDILKMDPAVMSLTYHPQSLDDLRNCLTEIAKTYRSRDHYSRLSIILHSDSLLYPTDVELSKKVDLMYHEGLTIIAPIERPIPLPAYIMLEERG